MSKTLEQLWAERPGGKIAIHRPSNYMQHRMLLERSRRLFEAAKRASKESPSLREDAIRTIRFLRGQRNKLASLQMADKKRLRLENVLARGERKFSNWLK